MSPSFNAEHYQQLMDGLEASECLLSNLERTTRLDSEYFNKSNRLLLSDLLSKNSVSIADFLSNLSDGNHISISKDFVDEEGYPYYRGGDSNNFVIEHAKPYLISKSAFKAKGMKRSYIYRGDVLLSIVGTIGNVSLVTTDEMAACNCKLAILRPKTPEYGVVLALFLKGKYGQSQIQLIKRGAVQQGLILEDIPSIKVPVFSEEFIAKLQKLLGNSLDFSQTAISTYREAEERLSQYLGIVEEVQDVVSIQKLKESFLQTGRLDAEYYQPKYEKMRNLVLSMEHTTIGDVFSLVKTKPIFSSSSCNYIEIGDIDINTGECAPNSYLVDELPANAKIQPAFGDVLISKVRPNRGAVSVVSEFYDNLVVSGAFTVLRSKEVGERFSAPLLQLMLRTDLYKEWLLQFNVGTSYPVIKDEDILTLPIPLFAKDVQNELISYVQKSMSYRKQAKDLLKLATNCVELAIDKSEADAITMLTDRQTDRQTDRH